MPRSNPYFEIICNILGSGCSTVNKSLSTQEDRGLNPVNTSLFLGSGCGTIDRAVAYNTRGPGFESSHR